MYLYNVNVYENIEDNNELVIRLNEEVLDIKQRSLHIWFPYQNNIINKNIETEDNIPATKI